MRISDDALDELVQIYKAEFEEKLTREEAVEVGNRLITLYSLLAKRMPDEHTGTATQHDEDHGGNHRRA
jgi:hypothetical protein